MQHNEILDLEINKNTSSSRRRNFLPWWIKLFCWMFMFAGLVNMLIAVASAFDVNFHQSIYGLSTHTIRSPLGVFLFFIFT